MRVSWLCCIAVSLVLLICGCGGGGGGTSEVGQFEGLFDGVASGFNFPFDIGIVPLDPPPASEKDVPEGGDIYVASYGTSQIMVARDPSGGSTTTASVYEGPSDGLMGAMAVSIPPPGDIVWAAFEQGGTDGKGGLAVLDREGTRLAVLDAELDSAAFANPGGLCWGGWNVDETRARLFLVNMGDGTVWRISVANLEGDDPELVRVGSGLATGTLGNPGAPGSPITTSSDTPEGGARGCAFDGSSLYVADAQNSRVVRFDGAHDGADVDGVPLEDTPSNLTTFPTGVAVNDEGHLVVISYDNAHAFVTLELPSGGFLDNGLHDLNVNSGNYGVAVAYDTIWFTRANNRNGTLRAITRAQDIPPSTAGPFPPQ